METEKEIVIGNDVLYVDPSKPYNVHFPFARGDINLHDGIGETKIWAVKKSICSFLECP